MVSLLRHFAFAVAALGALAPAAAPAQMTGLQILPAAEAEPGAFQWVARLIVVFADSPADPRYVQQMQMIEDGAAALIDRDVVVILDTDPDAESAWRQLLRPRGFMLALIGKDGEVKLRKPLPRDVRELSAQIDKMPMRQQELRDRGQRVR
jgi:hypothetical protein